MVAMNVGERLAEREAENRLLREQLAAAHTELTALMRRNGPIMADLIYGLLIVILALLNQSSSRAKRSSS